MVYWHAEMKISEHHKPKRHLLRRMRGRPILVVTNAPVAEQEAMHIVGMAVLGRLLDHSCFPEINPES